MPVRIYEIAKKLGVESKVVLLRAKELGIATAKVPSSSLDKITAEYLEQQMAAIAPPPLPPPSEVLPVQLVAAPQTPAPSAQESGGDSRRAFVSGRTPSSSEFLQNPDGVGREGEKSELESDSESHTTPHISSGIQSEEQVRSFDALDTGGGEPNTGSESLPSV